MKLYDEEWKAFQAFKAEEESAFPFITDTQKHQLLAKAAELKSWQGENPHLHNLLTLFVVIFNLAALFFFGYYFPIHFQLSLIAEFFIGLVFGLLMYGMTVYSLHEVNAHNQGFRGKSLFINLGNFIVFNLCRLNYADPIFYKTQHYSHHSVVGTKEDKAFTNAISLKRFLISIIPFCVATPMCDYKIHTSDEWSKSKAVSEILSTIFLISIVLVTWKYQSGVHALIFLVMAPWSSFFFDRLRETSEHNFMPDKKGNEARSFGMSFWGMIIGGGPWGQSCHLAHHLAPALPWYLQLKLHQSLELHLDEKQKKVFLRGGFFDYPKLWIEIIQKQKKYF